MICFQATFFLFFCLISIALAKFFFSLGNILLLSLYARIRLLYQITYISTSLVYLKLPIHYYFMPISCLMCLESNNTILRKISNTKFTKNISDNTRQAFQPAMHNYINWLNIYSADFYYRFDNIRFLIYTFIHCILNII